MTQQQVARTFQATEYPAGAPFHAVKQVARRAIHDNPWLGSGQLEAHIPSLPAYVGGSTWMLIAGQAKGGHLCNKCKPFTA